MRDRGRKGSAASRVRGYTTTLLTETIHGHPHTRNTLRTPYLPGESTSPLLTPLEVFRQKGRGTPAREEEGTR